MNQTNIIQSASLYFREGSSDKIYNAAIESDGGGYVVTFNYGRRGSTLTTGAKTDEPLPLETATKLFDKLLASKVAKGYKHADEPAGVYKQTGAEGTDTGIRCQLLNAVDESRVQELLKSKCHCMQEKHDGRRLMVRKQGGEVLGINRRGLIVAVPEPIRQAVGQLPVDALIDGEAVGDTLHAFDLLEVDGSDIRDKAYINRYAQLRSLLDPRHMHLRPAGTIIETPDKRKMFKFFQFHGSEGVVFKDLQAPFTPSRPNSGGSQLKFKFVEGASFIVTAVNAKRSVSLGLYHDQTLVPAGNVTIPPNHSIPEAGEVAEVRFLYAHPQSGAIYQPVYQGKRSDIPEEECTTNQLKYKASIKGD